MDDTQRSLELYMLLRSAPLVPAGRAIKPQVGDIVIEASRCYPDATMIGVLDAIEGPPDHPFAYLVTNLDGEKQRWTDATARVVQMSATRT